MSTDQLKRFRDKVAVVTGAARGLGKRIAEAFVSEGGSVAMMGRNVAALEAAAAELGAMAVAFPTDMLCTNRMPESISARKPLWSYSSAVAALRARFRASKLKL